MGREQDKASDAMSLGLQSPLFVFVDGMVPTSWQDEALARDGVSREVPYSALKGETVPDSLPATPKSPPTRRVPPRARSFSGGRRETLVSLAFCRGP